MSYAEGVEGTLRLILDRFFDGQRFPGWKQDLTLLSGGLIQ